MPLYLYPQFFMILGTRFIKNAYFLIALALETVYSTGVTLRSSAKNIYSKFEIAFPLRERSDFNGGAKLFI